MNQRDDEFYRRTRWHPPSYIPEDDLEPTAEEEMEMIQYNWIRKDDRLAMERSLQYRYPFAILGIKCCCLPVAALGLIVGGFFMLLLVLDWLS